jgi:hypothetical protein
MAQDEQHNLCESQVLEKELKQILPDGFEITPPDTGQENEGKGAIDKEADRLSAIRKAVHELHKKGKPLTALCLSGGGIRSATFCLGVITALAKHKQLDEFHYMSTVSGGGYIGSWLSRWIKTEDETKSNQNGGLAKVINDMRNYRQGVDPEPSPIQSLRAFSNYLAPRRGWSSDSWSLIVLYLRNLFLNWLILLPLLFAVLLLPRLHLSIFNSITPGDWVGKAGLVGGTALLAIGVFLISASLPCSTGWRTKDNSLNALLENCCPFLLCTGAWMLTWAWASYLTKPHNFDYIPLVSELCMKIGATQYTLLVVAALISGVAHIPAAIYAALTTEKWKMVLLGFGASMAASVGVLWFGMSIVLPSMWSAPAGQMLFTTFAVPYAMLSYFIVGSVWIGINARWSCEADREWWASSGAGAAAMAVGWIIIHSMVFFIPIAVLRLGGIGAIALAGAGGLSGIATATGGYWSRKSRFSDPGNTNKLRDFLGKWGLRLGALLFIVLFLGVGGSLCIGSLSVKINNAFKVSSFYPNGTFTFDKFRLFGTRESEQNEILSAKNEGTVIALGPNTNNKYSNVRSLYEKHLLAGIIELLFSADFAFSNGDTSDDKQKSKNSSYSDTKLLIDQFLKDQGQKDNVLMQAADDAKRQAAQKELRERNSWLGRMLYKMNDGFFLKSDSYRRGFEKGRGLPFLKLLLGWAGLVASAFLFSYLFGVNRFSLHNVYANRLIRAYLGASRSKVDRKPDPLSGFDENDNVPMSELPGGTKYMPAAKPPEKGVKLFHILNTTLNLVGGDRLDWQQRKGSSFTISPLHAGSWELGYQPVEDYGGEKEEITLGKAMAISGAAVSPNMGFHSSSLVACVMTFFNVRLGWWLPNPSKEIKKRCKRMEPQVGLFPLIQESIGSTTDKSAFVYLSDGGHFDNLGLYEMVRRRCSRIFLVDASADPDYRYEDLAMTIRKIRTDMGVSVEFPKKSGPALQRPPKGAYTIGRIRYSDVDRNCPNGVLVYLKPVLMGGEPIDVREYARDHSKGSDRFPHQSTADQFFDETQFESYRMLGYHMATQMMIETRNWRKFIRVGIEAGSAGRETLFAEIAGADGAIARATPPEGVQSDFSDTIVKLTDKGQFSNAVGTVKSIGPVMALGTALTVGGIIGVSGTVALRPDSEVHGRMTIDKPNWMIGLNSPDGKQPAEGGEPPSSTMVPPEVFGQFTTKIKNLSQAVEDLSDAVGSSQNEVSGSKNEKKSELANAVRSFANELNAFAEKLKNTDIKKSELAKISRNIDIILTYEKDNKPITDIDNRVKALERETKVETALKDLKTAIEKLPRRSARGVGGEQ